MAAIGSGWAEGSWIRAGWVIGAWVGDKRIPYVPLFHKSWFLRRGHRH